MRKDKHIIIVLIMIITLSSLMAAQDVMHQSGLTRGNQRTPAQNVFTEIEEAISKGDVPALSAYLCTKTYFSLSNGKSGYFSTNQAFYILQDFFKIYNVISFRLTNIHSDESIPYATGVYGYEFKGKRNNAQVYISLKYAGRSWQISQITIN